MIFITKGRHQWKNTFSFGHCPNFLALFQEVHFWSIKRVYFFKNANVVNFLSPSGDLGIGLV